MRLSLAKKKTFLQLCDLFKRNKQYIFNKNILEWSSLCEIYENALFLANGMNKKLFPECHLPITIHDLVAKCFCSNTESCMIGECSKCSSTNFSVYNFNTTSISDSDLTSLSDFSHVDEEDENVEGVLILATLLSVYSPHVAISILLRIK